VYVGMSLTSLRLLSGCIDVGQRFTRTLLTFLRSTSLASASVSGLCVLLATCARHASWMASVFSRDPPSMAVATAWFIGGAGVLWARHVAAMAYFLLQSFLCAFETWQTSASQHLRWSV